MYQVSVLAVILFVNGVQIPLSSPAILEDQVTWVPVRAVFQELGWEVKWDGVSKSINLLHTCSIQSPYFGNADVKSLNIPSSNPLL